MSTVTVCSFLRLLARDESRREYFTRFSRIPVKKLSVYDNKDCCNGLYMCGVNKGNWLDKLEELVSKLNWSEL